MTAAQILEAIRVARWMRDQRIARVDFAPGSPEEVRAQWDRVIASLSHEHAVALRVDALIPVPA